MAKAAKEDTNGYDPQVVQSLVGRVEGFLDDLESERGTYMQRCRSIRESISAVLDEGDARGIPKKELRVMIKARGKLKKARELIEDLEAEQRETVELLAEAFGDSADLPLFASKIRRAEEQAHKADGATAG